MRLTVIAAAMLKAARTTKTTRIPLCRLFRHQFDPLHLFPQKLQMVGVRDGGSGGVKTTAMTTMTMVLTMVLTMICGRPKAILLVRVQIGATRYRAFARLLEPSCRSAGEPVPFAARMRVPTKWSTTKLPICVRPYFRKRRFPRKQSIRHWNSPISCHLERHDPCSGKIAAAAVEAVEAMIRIRKQTHRNPKSQHRSQRFGRRFSKSWHLRQQQRGIPPRTSFPQTLPLGVATDKPNPEPRALDARKRHG